MFVNDLKIIAIRNTLHIRSFDLQDHPYLILSRSLSDRLSCQLKNILNI